MLCFDPTLLTYRVCVCVCVCVCVTVGVAFIWDRRRDEKPALAPGTCLNNPPMEAKLAAKSAYLDAQAAKFKLENVPMLMATMKKHVEMRAFQLEGLRALRALSVYPEGRATSLKVSIL